MVFTPPMQVNSVVGGDDIVSKWSQFYYDAWRTWGVYYNAAYRDMRAYAGDNWLEQEKRYLEQQKRMVLELNKIRRVVNLFSGYERENRLSTIVSPIEASDDKTAEDLTDVMLYLYDKGNYHQIFSEAFEHSLKSGLAMIHVYMDYSQDQVNGDIKVAYRPFNAMMLDPYLTRRDLSDCDQASCRDLLSKEQVKGLLPFVDPKIIDNIPTGIRDNKYQYLGIYRQYNSTYISKNLLTYDQYWVRKHVPQKWVVNIDDGTQVEFNGDKQEEIALKEMLANQPHLRLYNTYKQSVQYNVIVGSQLLYSGPDPTGLDDFPFVPVLCYFEPLIDTYELKIQGVVRSIRDAQRIYNRRHSQIIDIMESVVNTGWISKNGAVLDPTMLFTAGAGRNIVVNESYGLDDLREIQPPQIPPGYLTYQDIMDKNIMEIPGGSEELLGLSREGDSQVSGRLAEVRASNGLKGNRGLFDNFEYTLKLVGNLVLKTIQKQYTPGKVQRIIGREPSPQFFSGEFEKYDCTIKQAVLTQTQREAYYYQLLQLKSIGVNIPDDELVMAAPLMNKSKLLERMQQQQQAAEQAAQVEQEQMAIDRELQLSQKEENLALAQERRARVISDLALARERMSESDNNRAKALLDNVKAVAEIEDIDRRRLIEVLGVAAQQKQAEDAMDERRIQLDIQRAAMLEKAKSSEQQQPMGGSNG